VGWAANELGFFDGGAEFAVLEYGGRGVAEEAAGFLDDHFFGCPVLDFGPGVLEGHGTVEDRLAGGGIGIHREVPDALELERGRRVGERGFELAVRQHFERVRIEVGGEILAFPDLAGFFGEKGVVRRRTSPETALAAETQWMVAFTLRLSGSVAAAVAGS